MDPLTEIPHPSLEVFQRFRRRELSPRELLELDDHLAACPPCRERLAAPADLHAACAILTGEAPRAASAGTPHLSLGQLTAYVDLGRSAPGEAEIRAHLLACPRCTQEHRDLLQLRQELDALPVPEPQTARESAAPSSDPAPSWFGWLTGLFRSPLVSAVGLAAAVVLLVFLLKVQPAEDALREAQSHVHRLEQSSQEAEALAARNRKLEAERNAARAAVPELTRQAKKLEDENRDLRTRLAARPQEPTGGVLLKDGSDPILVGPDHRLSRVTHTEPLPDTVASALLNGRLDLPPDVTALLAPASVTRGNGVAFTVQSPVATAVRSPRPEFRWSPVPGATRYEVVLTDRTQVGPPDEINAGALTHWQPAQPLAAGHQFEWQVRAYQDAQILGTAPAARFQVLDATRLATLEKELARYPDSPLTRCILLLRAGLFSEAETELQKLAVTNPGSAVVMRLQESLRHFRRPSPPPPT